MKNKPITPLDQNNAVGCHKQWPIIDVVSLQNQNKYERYKHILVSDATYMPVCASSSHPDYSGWHNTLVLMEKLRVAREYLPFLLVSAADSPGWLVLRLFRLQPHAVKVLHANTLLDLNNIRCESSEGEYQDDSDSIFFAFLFFQRNWHRCWLKGLGQGNSGYDFVWDRHRWSCYLLSDVMIIVSF